MGGVREMYKHQCREQTNRQLYKGIMIEGRVNSSQDGIIINAEGIAPTHTAGHGNCPKVLVEGSVSNSQND